MNRKEFLSKLSAGAALALTAGCFGACTKDNGSIAPNESVDFSIDLNAPQSANLQNNGGYIVNQRVVVPRTNRVTM